MAEIISIQKAVKLIPDGSMIFVGGSGLNRNPMAFCREMVRQNKRGMHVVGVVGSLAIDMMAAAGVINRVEMAEFCIGDEMDALYLRQRIIEGKITAEVYSALAMCMRMHGGASGVPFMPVKSMMMTDLKKSTMRGDSGKSMMVACPFTGEAVNVIPSVNPDVSVIHVLRADKEGNFEIEGPVENDLIGFKAGDVKIIVAEEIVEKVETGRRPATACSGKFFRADFVVEAAHGAWPTAMPGAFASDKVNIKFWHDESYAKYFSKFMKPKEAVILKNFDGKKLR
jgi:glutaconate CoA-transferase, subunit A